MTQCAGGWRDQFVPFDPRDRTLTGNDFCMTSPLSIRPLSPKDGDGVARNAQQELVRTKHLRISGSARMQIESEQVRSN